MFNGLECEQTNNDDTFLTRTIFLLTQTGSAGQSLQSSQPVSMIVIEKERARPFRRQHLDNS